MCKQDAALSEEDKINITTAGGKSHKSNSKIYTTMRRTKAIKERTHSIFCNNQFKHHNQLLQRLEEKLNCTLPSVRMDAIHQ